VLPLRNSISPPRETSIPSIKSTLTPSKPLKTHPADDCSIISRSSNFCGTLNQPYTRHVSDMHWMGDIARALVGRKRDTYSGARESMCVRIAVLLLRCSDPSRQLASYGDILRDKLSFIIISSNKMTQLQPQARSRYSLRVSDGAADDSPCGCRQSIIESEAALSTYCILLEVDQARRRRIAPIPSLAKA